MSPPDPTLAPENDPLGFLAGGGNMGLLIRSMDWSGTPLGPVASWPQSLRTTVSLCLASNFPINIIWGPGRVQIYNDGYWPICGGKHPRSMGQDFRESWESAWPAVGDAFDRALAGGAEFIENRRMFLDRNGYLEETFFTFSFSPIRDETGGVGGLFHPVTETTSKMLSERRTRALRDLSARTSEAKSVNEALALSTLTFAEYDLDLPFVLLYSLDPSSREARLVATTGVEAGTPASPRTVDLEAAEPAAWPLAEAVRSRSAVQVDDAARRFGARPYGPYPEPPDVALVLPITPPGASRPVVLLVVGKSPRLPLNEAYRGFYDLLGSGVATAVVSARAYEEEKKRAEALAELDRAKTAFFSNVSHEFRTPLTLILGPVEDLLGRGAPDLSAAASDLLAVVHRNSLRLLKLVNTMLDFSRIESGRIQASYEPVDLAACTAELASVFRATIERAGLRLLVHCPTLPEPVYVDRDMWEKIVLNLLSNAFKFTLEGEIEVRLEGADRHAVLTVQDTGVGIPPSELPRVFERFHRVKESRGRAHEGTGIGLALVQELSKLLGGTVSVDSVLNEGSRFVVTLPLGTAHLDPQRIGLSSSLTATTSGAEAFVQEAQRWLPSGGPAADADRVWQDAAPRARVLWADDNADMREYVARLLGERFDVVAVADGQAALEAARADPPDLVITDVMMPRLDGAGLLRELRATPRLREIPVILLSARAGEEARVEGMAEGADDYLIKPFSARELLARVDAHARMARLRREAGEAVRRSEERLRQITNIEGVGVLLFDPSTGTLLDANDAFLRMLGYGREEVAAGALTWRTMTPPEYVAVSEQQLEGLAAVGRIGPYEKEYFRKDGSRSWMVFAGALLGDGTVVEYCIDVSDRKRAEVALRESEAALRRAHDELEARVAERTAELGTANQRLREEIRERQRAEAVRTELLRRLATAQEDERRRMSRDLHDQTGQLLAGLALAIKAVSISVALPPTIADRLADIQRVSEELGRQVHGLALRLRPTALDDLGLGAALAQLVGEWSTGTGVTVDFQIAGLGPERLPAEVETVLYRVVQESLTNVAKHARAGTVSVVVSGHDGTATAAVEDDGVGFDPEAAERGRLGLMGMRERVALVGGELAIESALGAGATVIATIPLVG